MNVERFGDIAQITLPTPFPIGDVNVYIIMGDPLTLVDAGVKTAAAWEAFVSGLSQLGYAPEDIGQVVLTHHHPDHIGLLDFLPDDTIIIGHRYGANWLSRDEELRRDHYCFFRGLFYQFGLPKEMEPQLNQIQEPLSFGCDHSELTLAVKEGDRLPGLVDWIVFETPGHSQSHLVFFRERDGTLLAGDHVLASVSSNPLLEPSLLPGEERPKPQVQYNHSLKKMLELPISVAYTGHGKEIKRIHPLIIRRLELQHKRAMQVKEMLAEQPLTAFEVCKQLFPNVYKKQMGLTLSESVGQLDYLLSIDEIGVHPDDRGILYYFPL
ncbi:MBL fold metallo-hydrolase [Bacillus xiapuensis]|uniref:MBL fold metallo-hydrolase n=1 Tax=Bacillus xiapuensis TaxID=2014075 RepID=UPI000C2483B1|nr:MBL fold metallo-hydrolase [Bacillus xiapuensis]